MKVFVGNQLVNVDNLDVIGPGGEGLVVKLKNGKNSCKALKVYHPQLQTRERSEKLESFFSRKWNLPADRIAVPTEPVYNEDRSRVIGITMPYLGTGIDDIAQLSNKVIRLSYRINTKRVAQIFLDGLKTLEQVHLNGLVVGDLSDRNVLFRQNEMFWIDVDSWQFGRYPCPVATEEYVDPNLYGIDFSKRPSFLPENDWYSYAVLLFRSLLMVHPYGGVHKEIKEIKRRAQNKIVVFNKDVIYPKIALSPDILSDDLANEFEEIFKNGARRSFPKEILQSYIEDLVECTNCHTWYPKNRKGCPSCNKQNIVVMVKHHASSKDLEAIEFFKTTGDIVYSKIIKDMLYVITHENGNAILHTFGPNNTHSQNNLLKVCDGVRYAMTKDMLVVNPGHSQELAIYDTSTKNIQLLKQTSTEIYEPNRRAAFQSTGNRILRIVGGNILSIEKGIHGIVERPIKICIPNQTWFSSNDSYEGMQMFGLIQILHDKRFWYHIDGKNFEPEIPKLAVDEVLTDISVKFSRDEVLLRRKTQQNGIDYIRQEIIDNEGNVVFTMKTRYEDYPVKNMHGQVYFNGILLHATDEGIVHEKVKKQEFKTFEQTSPYVGEGDTLYKFDKGIIVVNSNSITYLQLK